MCDMCCTQACENVRNAVKNAIMNGRKTDATAASAFAPTAAELDGSIVALASSIVRTPPSALLALKNSSNSDAALLEALAACEATLADMAIEFVPGPVTLPAVAFDDEPSLSAATLDTAEVRYTHGCATLRLAANSSV